MRLYKLVSHISAVALVIYTIFPGAALVDAQGQAYPGENISICHWGDHGYEQIAPNVNGVLNGHAKENENDIIPPFDYGDGEHYDGMNWTSENEAFWNDDCSNGSGEEEGDGSLTVIKHVVGGDKEASDFRIYVSKLFNENDSEILHDFYGSESGTTFDIPAGTKYHVVEDQQDGYELSQTDTCHGTMESDADVTCTLTNTFSGEEQGDATLVVSKYICTPGTQITDEMVPNDSGDATISDNCVLAEGDLSGQQVGTIFESGKTENTSPYPTDFTEEGTIGTNGKLTITNSEAGRYDIAEGDGEDNYDPAPDGFIGIACNDDSGSHTDNYEVALVNPGETDYCSIFNEGEVLGEATGTLHINKYVCDEGTEFTGDMTPDASGNATIPDGCDKATAGYKIGSVFEEGNTTGNPPYPTFDQFELMGTTNSSGELVTQVLAGGRHFLAEADAEGNFTETNPDLIAFACEDDGGSHVNNFEAVFVEEDSTEYCNVYNLRNDQGGGEEGSMLHFMKVICPTYGDISGNGSADAEDATGGQYVNFANYSDSDPHFADSYAYKPVSPDEIPENCNGAEGWSFRLSTDQAQTENVQTIGTTDANGEFSISVNDLNEALKDAVTSGDRIWVSEVNQDSVATFGTLRCYNDAMNGDNLEFVELNPEDMADHVYCIAYNVMPEETGNVVITKYVCPEDIDFDTSDNSTAKPDDEGNATVPNGCELANGYHFGYIHEADKTDASGPYPGLNDSTAFTAISGETGDNGTGKLILNTLPTGGRLDLAELDSEGNRISDDDVIGFMCNEDPGIQDNNYEVVFNADDKTSYCNVYNVEGGQGGADGTVLHLVKVICPTYSDITGNGSADNADATGGNYVDFANYSDTEPHFASAYGGTIPINPSEIPENCERAEGWNFALSTDEAQTNPEVVGPTDSNGEFTINVNDLSQDLQDALANGGLWVSEVENNEVASFGSLRCYRDALNGDNLERVDLGQDNVDNAYCIAYNVESGQGGGEETTTVHLIKVICPTTEDIDSIEGTTPIATSEIPENCDRASGWNFQLSTDQAQAAPTTFGPTDSNGEVNIGLSSFGDDLEEALSSGSQVWVSEEAQDDVATFGNLRCYNDAGNNDNLEFIQLDPENMASDVYCIAYNVDVLNECPDDSQTNLLINGGFEAPQVTDSNGWDVYPSGTSGLGWTVSWADADPGSFDGDTRPTTANLELQNSTVGFSPQEGSQNAELDTDWEGPTGDTSGEPANVIISQQVDATTDQDYTLTYWAAIRDGSGGSAGDLVVRWNGDTISPTAGTTSGIWTEYTATVTGADGMDVLSFTETGTGDALGTLLDNVSLVVDCDNDNGGEDTDNGGGGGGGGGSSTRRISGVKYNDLNGNGTQDADEDGMSGWVIYMDENNNNVWDADEEARTTDSDGEYRFSSISNGTYTIREVGQAGWTQTEPGSGSDEEYVVEVTSSDKVHSDIDFGNTAGAVGGVSIDNNSGPQGQVLGESIDLGGGDSLPVTGLKASVLLLFLMLSIAIAMLPQFNRREF